MISFSKSKYCGLWQCPKIAWLRQYKPELAAEDEAAEARMDVGNKVGDLAMGLFGDYIDVTAYKEDKIDIPKMISDTVKEMEKGTENICEASFSYNGLYCAVDILRRDGDGWAVYEVKSSSSSAQNKGKKNKVKDVYIADISYQKYVLEHCGIKVTGTYLVCINSDYVLEGELDISSLFLVIDVSEAVDTELPCVEKNIALAERILSTEEEPDIDLHTKCNDPYPCPFWNYCSRHLPERSVFDIGGMWFSKKIGYYKKGFISYRDVLDNVPIKSDAQIRQLIYGSEDKGDLILKDEIDGFLSKLSYPLYFLDFETMQPAVPQYQGTKPYAQIPFQYSLHFIEQENGELMHREFLAEPDTDPRRMIAEQLCHDIPLNVCTLAYNKAFECGRLKDLAALFPDLSYHLLNIADNIIDLADPFSSGWYYNRDMGGSYSIKSVLPALFPDDPELDYHNLEGIQNGGDAMRIYPMMGSMTPEEREKARKELLKYCELDTYAMVKIWQKLREVCQNS